jgi:hypothetical protein
MIKSCLFPVELLAGPAFPVYSSSLTLGAALFLFSRFGPNCANAVGHYVANFAERRRAHDTALVLPKFPEEDGLSVPAIHGSSFVVTQEGADILCREWAREWHGLDNLAGMGGVFGGSAERM